ncbi:MAG: hypothetical protein K2M54_00385, partial [Muribaculaceae bacterium]|nr:hypothetical protein [Muribaculaceae bacterium]
MNFQKTIIRALALTVIPSAASMTSSADEAIISTDAYTWRGDTIIQDEYRAWAPNVEQIISTYHAQPGYY